jgi:hypothetical protein
MTKTFTQNDIIRYLYNETNQKETQSLREQLLIDEELREHYAALSQIVHNVAGIHLEPSQSSLAKVLDYSKNLNLHSV